VRNSLLLVTIDSIVHDIDLVARDQDSIHCRFKTMNHKMYGLNHELVKFHGMK
jgi:hypothetical protein